MAKRDDSLLADGKCFMRGKGMLRCYCRLNSLHLIGTSFQQNLRNLHNLAVQLIRYLISINRKHFTHNFDFLLHFLYFKSSGIRYKYFTMPFPDKPLADSSDITPQVVGVFARRPLADNPKDNLEKKNQVMARRRLKLRSVAADATNQCSGLVEEGEGKRQNEENGSKAYETAMVVPKHGLVGSIFYHNNLDEHSDSEDEDEGEGEVYPKYEINEEDRIFEERTLLFQSLDHYQHLATNTHTASYFAPSLKDTMEDRDAEAVDFVPDAKFGEQIVVKGCTALQICIGDVFAFVSSANKSDENGLLVEITSPRLACAEVDKKNGSPFGKRGLRRYANTRGLAGWFARVLRPGEVCDGMILKRKAHPYPKWNLAEVSMALYGECYDPKYTNLCWPQWNRSKEELEELCSLEQFGWYEWKEEAQWLLDRWDKIQNEKKATIANDTKKKMEHASAIKQEANTRSMASTFPHDVWKDSRFNVQASTGLCMMFLLARNWESLASLATLCASNFMTASIEPITEEDVAKNCTFLVGMPIQLY